MAVRCDCDGKGRADRQGLIVGPIDLAQDSDRDFLIARDHRPIIFLAGYCQRDNRLTGSKSFNVRLRLLRRTILRFVNLDNVSG